MNKQELIKLAKEIFEMADAEWTEGEDFMDLVYSCLDSEENLTEEERDKIIELCEEWA